MNVKKLEDILEVMCKGFGMAFIVLAVWFMLTNIIEAEFRDETQWPISESRYGLVSVVNPGTDTTLLSYHGSYIYSYYDNSDEFTIVENEHIHRFNKSNGDCVIIEEVK